jgi:hypothetical protein
MAEVARTEEPAEVAAPATAVPAPPAEEPQTKEAAAATEEAKADEPAAEAEEVEEAPPATVTAEVPAEGTAPAALVPAHHAEKPQAVPLAAACLRRFGSLDDSGLDRARLAVGRVAPAGANLDGLPSLERQRLRRQVRDELGSRFTAQPAGPEPQARAGPRSPACEAALSSLERQQLRRQVRLELQTVPALPAADVLPVAAAAPPGPGPVPGPQVQAVPDPLALKAAVEAIIGASTDMISLNALRVELELRLGLPVGDLVAFKLEIKALACAWIGARMARGSADLD